MNKFTVMVAIERRMDWLYKNVICNEKNAGKELKEIKSEISELHEAFFELKGTAGSVSNISNYDGLVNNVKSIFEIINI